MGESPAGGIVQPDCEICKGPCLAAFYCLECGQAHRGYTEYAVNGQLVSYEQFVAFLESQGSTMSAHGHPSNSRWAAERDLLEEPLTEERWAWTMHEQAVEAHAELVRRGAVRR